MKQSEKLDIILRYLYDRKDDNKEYSIDDILLSSSIDTISKDPLILLVRN
jgi:hypothetical protein